jgi:hypothetical protein
MSILVTLSDNAGLLFAVLALMVAGLLFLRRRPRDLSPSAASTRKAVRTRRQGGPLSSLFRRIVRNGADQAIYEQEFFIANGVNPRAYLVRTRILSIGVALPAYLVTGSWAVALVSFVALMRFRSGRAASRLEKLRAGLLGEEVIPVAQNIAANLTAGMSLTQALGETNRGQNSGGLGTAIRRAMSDPRGLEEGMREEERRSIQETIKEFFEILADGASVARQTAITAETLEKFAEINMRRRTSYQQALRATAQARGTRSLMGLMIPGVMVVSILTAGAEAMLRTTGGNVAILAVALLLNTAFLITNRQISSVMKGF